MTMIMRKICTFLVIVDLMFVHFGVEDDGALRVLTTSLLRDSIYLTAAKLYFVALFQICPIQFTMCSNITNYTKQDKRLEASITLWTLSNRQVDIACFELVEYGWVPMTS